MTIHTANLGLVSLPNAPAVGNVRGGNVALRHHVKQMLSAQDQALTAGRRIVYQSGMLGYSINSVGDCAIDSTADQIKAHPYTDDAKIIGRIDGWRLTPGHVLAVSVRALPSAHVQRLIYAEPTSSHFDDGQSGSLLIESTWGSPGETDLEVDISVDADGDGTSTFGHCGHATQSGFSALIEKYTLLLPSAMIYDSAEVEKYCREGVTVDLAISNVGGLRPVDVCIWEIPYKAAFDDSTSNSLPAHCYQNNEVPVSNYPPEYAIEGASGDPRFGVDWANSVALTQNRAINPSGFNWGSHSESEVWDTSEEAGLSLPPTEAAVLAFDAAALCYGQRFHNSNDVVMPDTGCVLIGIGVYHSDINADVTLRLRDESGDEVASFTGFTDSTVTPQWDHFSVLLETGDSQLDDKQHTLTFEGTGPGPKVSQVTINVIPELE